MNDRQGARRALGPEPSGPRQRVLWQLAFLSLLGLTVWSLVWLHIAVLRLRAASSLLDHEGHLPVQYTTASPL